MYLLQKKLFLSYEKHSISMKPYLLLSDNNFYLIKVNHRDYNKLGHKNVLGHITDDKEMKT